jgi:hypothetical protein
MLEQDRLNFRRRDILATHADHLFDSADESQITVLADHAEITGTKPTLFVQRFSVLFRIFEISLSDAPTAKTDFTSLPCR